MRYLGDLLERLGSQQWELPVAHALNGSGLYTLREIVARRPAIKGPASLNNEEGWELVLARMRMHRVYQMGWLEGYVGTPAEAVGAIESDSGVGRRIVADQQEYISALIEVVYGDSRAE